MTMENLYNSN